MPYNFGDWSQIGSDLGAKIAGRPSSRQAKEADRALAIKMAMDKSDYEKEQDKIKNFADYGGFDPEQVMAGGAEAALMGDEAGASLQGKMAGTPSLRAYKGFQKRMGEKYEGRLSLEDKIALERIHGEETRATKKTAPGAKQYDFGGQEDKPLEEPDAAPFKWSSFRTWGKQTKEDVAGWDKQSAQGSYKSKADVQAAYDAKKITAKQAQAEYAKFK
mgnify:CR=1 FL=1